MRDYEVPEHLASEILSGRCVAFVGAGFSASAVPTWRELLARIGEELGKEDPGAWARIRDALPAPGARSPSAFDLEVFGQLLQDAFPRDGAAFERAVKTVLDAKQTDETLDRRKRLLCEIPFESVLTTNLDQHLAGDAPEPRAYSEALRGHLSWYERSDWLSDRRLRRTTIKLHGDANGRPDENPVVLTRSEYRKRLYRDARYSNFLRAVFATRTILFLGVSFTDAYLNEIRSEILALLEDPEDPGPGPVHPRAYAVLPELSQAKQAYFRRHEGIQVLAFPIPNPGDFSGFDGWLEAIHGRTSPQARLAGLLRGKRIAWLDPHERNNEYGMQLLERAGAEVESLAGPGDLDPARHAGLDLLISHFGYHRQREAAALRLLAELQTWEDRPPVIVFASGYEADENRRAVLRRGAYEYTSEWPGLFKLIEQLFEKILGRRPSASSKVRQAV
ncbi:MAG: SIR2 family protein [Deltaproteobacteria bacterium]|nr:SIR2 family protein [Deltaproteobacteria bacterium]